MQREAVAATRLNPVLRDPRLSGLAIALLVHLALLGPAMWGLLAGETFGIEADPAVIPLDLGPSPSPGVRTRRAAPPLPSDAAPRAPVPTAAGRAAPPPPPGETGAPVSVATAPNASPVDETWRVGMAGRERPPWGGEVCRDLSNFRAWQAAGCREQGPVQQAAAKGSPPAEVARPEARRGRAPGQTGRDAFAEQAAANAAWSDYTRGEGGYPGLRSLMKHH